MYTADGGGKGGPKIDNVICLHRQVRASKTVYSLNVQ